MTRINCIPVQEINNQMLLAEYRELPRVSGLVWQWQDKIDDQIVHNVYRELSADSYIPETYRLGQGHVKFFYNKGEYLRRRFEEEIVPELQSRGYSLSYTKYRIHPDGMNRDWIPDEDAKQLNRQRIQDRLSKNKNKKGE